MSYPALDGLAFLLLTLISKIAAAHTAAPATARGMLGTRNIIPPTISINLGTIWIFLL